MAAERSPLARPAWRRALREAAAPERVEHWLNALSEAGVADVLGAAGPEQVRILAALFSGSQVLSERLLAHPEWLTMLSPEALKRPRHAAGMRGELGTLLGRCLAGGDYSGAFAELRRFKLRELCRVAARDLGRLGDAVEVTRELSDLADVCLSAVLDLCRRALVEQLGQPYHQDAAEVWRPTRFVVLGLGKLGGQELNYSSDVDLMFVYTEEGSVFRTTPGRGTRARAGLSNHQFFKRLADAFVAEVTRSTAEGMLYRVDMRLRPEGEAGPLARSLASCENYYAQWGQTWERMMLIKARGVAGDQELAEEFLEMIQPFRYPRHLHGRVLQEMAGMKARIENEVVGSRDLERNVKLGRGGIREIEFVVQTAQILRAGRIPFLQGPNTLTSLQKLVQYDVLAHDAALQLSKAYAFFRDVEHRLQMEQNLQTHTIPAAGPARERLARLMGFSDFARFEAVRREHAQAVRLIYDEQLKVEMPAADPPFPRDLSPSSPAWQSILAEHAFVDVPRSLRLLSEFVLGPGYVHISPRTTELAWELVPKLLALCPNRSRQEQSRDYDPARRVLSDPDRVLARLDSFVNRYGARAVLFETWTHHPSYFELLLLLFDRSEFLAETALRTPDLVDDLVLSGRLSRGKSAQETLGDLRHGLEDEDQFLWLRRYHEAELMRIGLRDILGLADFEQNLVELTSLAEACLQYALEVVLRKHRLKEAPFAIIGLGKLGGRELNFGSDLDIMFVASPKVRNLAALQRLAVGIMELLSKRTEQGVVFETDARLRPDGEKGLLVNTLGAFETYYRERAQLWEIQALSRTRPVAGNAELGRRFQSLVGTLANFSPANVASEFRGAARPPAKTLKAGRPSAPGPPKAERTGLAAYSPDWKSRIAAMRLRIEKERTPAGQEALAIKTGAGGLIDAEFIAQAMNLAHGWQEANTLRCLQRLQEIRVLPPEATQILIASYRQLRRIEGILRRWSLEGETELPADPAPYYRVSVRCGFKTPDLFRQAVATWRQSIRRVYNLVFI